MLASIRQYYKDVVRYRGLIAGLVQRHLAARYRGSFLGLLWSFLNPLCLMAVYTLVFQFYIRFEDVDHYTVFLFCGLLPWLWFASALQESTTSISGSGPLVTKAMFPAHILPAVTVLTTGVHFLVSLPLLFIFMLFFSVPFSWTMLFLPLVALLQLVVSFGLALVLGSLNVFYRDVQHLVANALTLLFFLCPILYPVEVVPEQLRFTLEYNPLAQLTIFYQELLLDQKLPDPVPFLFVSIFAIACVLLGMFSYERHRERFAEAL